MIEAIVAFLSVIIPAAIKIYLDVRQSKASGKAKGKALADVEKKDTDDAMARVDAEQQRVLDAERKRVLLPPGSDVPPGR